MNCPRAQAVFSEFLEGALEPGDRELLENHLAACEPCRQALRDTRVALVALRASGREEPPPGLAASIGERLAAQPPGLMPAPAAPRTFSWTAALAAAALLVACLAAYFAHARREPAGITRLAALEESLASWDRDRAALLAELQSARASVASGDATNEALVKSLEAKGVRLRLVEETLRDLEARLQSESRRIAGLENDLALERERAEGLSRDLALRPTSAAPPGAAAAGGGPAPVEAPPPAVVFRRRGGGLEVEVRGPLEAVIPQLFAVAWDDGDPELAEIALGALEAYLTPRGERSAVPAAASKRSGFSEFWDRRLAGLASIGGGGAAPSPEASAGDDTLRRQRLAELERIWRSRSAMESPNLEREI